MTPLLLLSIFAFLNTSATPAWSVLGPSCTNFTAGVSYEPSQTFGVWHLVHYRNNHANGTGIPHCLEFTDVEEEDRDILKSTYQKYVRGVDWHKITLLMTIPCQSLTYKRRKNYYLEKINGTGAYRTLLFPTTATYHEDQLNRNELRLKLVEDKYLCLMDCHERHIFIFSKQFPSGTANERRLAKMVEDYWG